MTFQKDKQNYKCDICKKEVIFATKSKCEKGDICYTCRNHTWEAAGIPLPTLKEAQIAQLCNKCPCFQINIGLQGTEAVKRREQINREYINREIKSQTLEE